MSAQPLEAQRSPWREPLVWMVVGIPALTIVAGLFTWWIAAQRADSNVAEDWYKKGLTINRSLERESRAQALGLRAEVLLAAEHDLRLTLQGPATAALPASLTLTLVHPVRAEQDRKFTLDRQADGSYRTVSPQVSAGHWALAIEAQDWRISARRIDLREGGVLRVGADGRVD